MNWVGKVGGAILGFIVRPSLLGAAVGAILGHLFVDRGLDAFRQAGRGGLGFDGLSSDERRRIFFETTFLVMGHLAKADGRVSEEEIRAARSLMHQMRLSPEDVRRAIDLFNRGKQPEFAIDEQVSRLGRACRTQKELLRTFLEIQFELALSKGSISPKERDLLRRVAGNLGVNPVELAQLEAILWAQRSFRDQQARSTSRDSLDQAYKALGVSANASDREIKTAYRRLMNEHHPDKQIARGLPDAMLEVAKEKTREIRAAYDLIKEHRGFK